MSHTNPSRSLALIDLMRQTVSANAVKPEAHTLAWSRGPEMQRLVTRQLRRPVFSWTATWATT